MVGWFEIPVTDMGRARAFYAAVFQVELSDLGMEGMEMVAFPWIENGPQSAGALVKSENMKPSMDGVKIYFTAENLEESLARVEEAGGKTLMPRTSIGEHGWIAMFEDTEGNAINLHSRNAA